MKFEQKLLEQKLLRQSLLVEPKKCQVSYQMYVSVYIYTYICICVCIHIFRTEFRQNY
jgi:hypothetical protein